MVAALVIALCVGRAAPALGALLAERAGVVGDSIARAFDADTDLCRYMDQPERSFATGDDHGESFCQAGGDGTFSHAERLECAKDGDVAIANDAESGANIGDFAEQADRIRARAADQPGPHYVPVLLGHNDACTNVTDKTGNGCGGDRDPDNYCRTTPAAFEREFRRGLDELIQIPSARLVVLALIRISQLCNFRDKNTCGALIGLECQLLWQSTDILQDVFGSPGVCTSLTSDCANQRRIDMYETLVGYNDILQRVTAEYAALPGGMASASGAVKAADVALRYLEAPFFYRFQSNDISCCDCFHPSDLGQRKLAEFAWDGMPCTDAAPCCGTANDPMMSARCGGTLDTETIYPGGFWADGIVCGNGIRDPDEACDDGNRTSGDGCSEACAIEGGPTPTPTGSPPATATVTPTPPAGDGCAGDCDDSRVVTVDELVDAVSIALGLQPVDVCARADLDADGSVTIAELLTAVNRLLAGCGSIAARAERPR